FGRRWRCRIHHPAIPGRGGRLTAVRVCPTSPGASRMREYRHRFARPEETPLTTPRPSTLKQLRDSGWQPKTVKHELRDNFLAALKRGDDLFPGIIGYENTVIPEI